MKYTIAAAFVLAFAFTMPASADVIVKTPSVEVGHDKDRHDDRKDRHDDDRKDRHDDRKDRHDDR